MVCRRSKYLDPFSLMDIFRRAGMHFTLVLRRERVARLNLGSPFAQAALPLLPLVTLLSWCSSGASISPHPYSVALLSP